MRMDTITFMKGTERKPQFLVFSLIQLIGFCRIVVKFF